MKEAFWTPNMFNFLNSKSQDPGITVILCAYDGPHVLEEQVKAIKDQRVPISDICLWYNKGDKPKVDVPSLKTAICNHNFKLFPKTKNELSIPKGYIRCT